MLFSIITPTSNSEKFLNKLIQSVKNQKCRDFEHIFIDNESSDKTIKILKKYQKEVNYNVQIFSKRDKGIYYAFNKGLYLSKGEIVTILNSDDFFSSNYTLLKVKNKFKRHNCNFLYGNITVVSRNNISKKIRKWISESVSNSEFFKVPHPSFFVRKNFLKINKINFNTNYQIASDLDFIIKCFKKSKKFYFFDKELVHQRSGGTSQKILNIIKANYEVYKILKSNNINDKLLFIYKKILFKLCQF